ncbi:MAG: hypothetical protein KY476_01190 [Planctomycetes bacterium]|nr:hypothetical protein [Planctomycetota bacterium]
MKRSRAWMLLLVAATAVSAAGGCRLMKVAPARHSDRTHPDRGTGATVVDGGAGGVVPAGGRLPEDGVIVAGGFQVQAPPVAGQRLGLYPGQTASELAVRLEEELFEANSKNEALTTRIAALEAQLAQKNERLEDATEQIRQARALLAEVRVELEAWKRQVDEIRGQLQAAEEANRATLEFIIKQLRDLAGEGEPGVTPGTP